MYECKIKLMQILSIRDSINQLDIVSLHAVDVLKAETDGKSNGLIQITVTT